MIESSDRGITPWVGRLLAANAVVLLLQQTVLTSDSLAQLLSFESPLALQRPWTFFTYMFVHSGILHLAANSLALFVFGPTVERGFGSRLFLVYYLLCGVGAAAFSMVLHLFGLGAEPFVGASGALLGVAYAYARMNPDAQLLVFPFPVPVRARYMILLLATYDVIGLFFINDGIAHGVHLGGLLTGTTFFLLRSFGRPSETVPLPSIRRRVPVVTGGRVAGRQTLVTPRPAANASDTEPQERPDLQESAELDRVLDKISAAGIDALSAEERRFLDAMARRRRDLN